MSNDASRRLAGALRKEQGLRLRQGEVTAVNPDGTIDLRLGASDTVIDDVMLLGGAAVGSGVWLLQQNGDLLALGGTGSSSGPRGLLGYATKTSEQTGISTTETDITGLSVTVSVPAGRLLKLTASALIRYGVGETSSVFFTIYDDDTETLLMYDRTHKTFLSNERWHAHAETVIEPTAGTHTYKIVAYMQLGVEQFRIATSTANPGLLMVEDVGPA